MRPHVTLIFIFNLFSIASYATPSWRDAVKLHDFQMVQKLLSDGENPFDVDSDGLNALHHAAKEGCEEITTLLVHYNRALLNCKTFENKEDRFINECTPLHIAIVSHDFDDESPGIVDKLLQLGADLATTTGSGLNALELACVKGDLDLVKFLLSYGANLEGECTLLEDSLKDIGVSLGIAVAGMGVAATSLLFPTAAAAIGFAGTSTSLASMLRLSRKLESMDMVVKPEIKKYLDHLQKHPEDLENIRNNRLVQNEKALNEKLRRDRKQYLKKRNELPVLDLARLSAGVYENAEIHDYELLDSIEDYGMRASYYYNHAEHVGVLVFRGSDNSADWLGRNLALFLAADPSFDPYGSTIDHSLQTLRTIIACICKNKMIGDFSIEHLVEQARDIYKSVIDDMVQFDIRAYQEAHEHFSKQGAKSVFVTGHSLGGIHAQVVSRMYEISGASFIAPGLPQTVSYSKYYNQKTGSVFQQLSNYFYETDYTKKYRFTNHRAKNDIVSQIAGNRTFLTIPHEIETDTVESHSIIPMIEHLSLFDHKRCLCCPLKCNGSIHYGTEKSSEESTRHDGYPSDDDYEFEDIEILRTDDSELAAAKREVNNERKNVKIRNQQKKAARLRHQIGG